jgi:selenium-binding protein 1
VFLLSRFLHEPTASDAYVGCALFSNIFHIFKTEQGDWAAEKVIDVLPKKVQQ